MITYLLKTFKKNKTIKYTYVSEDKDYTRISSMKTSDIRDELSQDGDPDSLLAELRGIIAKDIIPLHPIKTDQINDDSNFIGSMVILEKAINIHKTMGWIHAPMRNSYNYMYGILSVVSMVLLSSYIYFNFSKDDYTNHVLFSRVNATAEALNTSQKYQSSVKNENSYDDLPLLSSVEAFQPNTTLNISSTLNGKRFFSHNLLKEVQRDTPYENSVCINNIDSLFSLPEPH